MRVLITGGNGFVGKAIIKELLQKQYEVWALLNENSELQLESELKNKCKILNADIRKPINLNDLPLNLKFDAAIHSAGLAHQFGRRDEKDFWDVNVTGTANVLEAAAKLSIKRFILISSVSVYGNSAKNNFSDVGKGVDETAECQPVGAYAVTKFEAEKIARNICERNGISLTILRLATVIGEHDGGNVFRLIEAIKKRRFLWIGKGNNRKSLIYKGDVAKACVKVFDFPEKEGVYNLSANAVTMKEIVSEIHASMNRRKPKVYVPANVLLKPLLVIYRTSKIELFKKLSTTVEKWLSDEHFSGEKFQKEFDFNTSVTISEAIRREVSAYLQSK